MPNNIDVLEIKLRQAEIELAMTRLLLVKLEADLIRAYQCYIKNAVSEQEYQNAKYLVEQQKLAVDLAACKVDEIKLLIAQSQDTVSFLEKIKNADDIL